MRLRQAVRTLFVQLCIVRQNGVAWQVFGSLWLCQLDATGIVDCWTYFDHITSWVELFKVNQEGFWDTHEHLDTFLQTLNLSNLAKVLENGTSFIMLRQLVVVTEDDVSHYSVVRI